MEGFNGRISEGTLHCFFGLSMHTEYVNNSGVTRAFKWIRFWGHLLRTDSFFFSLDVLQKWHIFFALGAPFVHFSRVWAPQERKNDVTEIFLKFSLSEKSNDFLVYEICFMFCLFVLPKFDGAVSFRRVVSLEDMTSCCFLLPSCYGSCSL